MRAAAMMPMTKTLLAAACATLLAACTSLTPTLDTPVPPVAAAFPGSTSTDTDGTAAADLDWRTILPDAGLRALIETALANNRDLRTALANAQAARAQVDVRGADRFPTVGVQASAARQPSTTTGNQVNLFQLGLALTSWELDFFGRLQALTDAAQAQYLATEAAVQAARTTLVAQVASTWLSLVADEELLALTRETLRTREDTLRLTRLRFDNGVASELDLRLAESATETARAALAQQQRQAAQDRNALALLTGQPLPADWSTGTTLSALRVPDVPAGLPAQVLVRRPDVRQAEQQLIAANANIGAARAAFFPRISLTASAGRASSELGGLFDGAGKFAYTVAPSALLPIFDAGRNRANLASAQAQRDAAIAQYERSIQSGFREVSDALAGRATLGDQLAAQQKAAQAETVRNRLVQLRYDAGVASALDLLDAQRSLFTARTGEIQVRLAGLQNQVQLYRTLGGGWR